MRSVLVPLLAAAFATVAAGARAQDAPTPMPTRDVAVTYRLTDVNAPGREDKIKLTFAEQSERVRLDMFAYSTATVPYITVIYDRVKGRFLTLEYAQQAAHPANPKTVANPGALLAAAREFTRQGDETLLETPCTDWAFTNADGARGTACVTDFGVVLRLTREGQQPVTMEAVTLKFASPPESVFLPPADLRLVVPKQPHH
jgi:hypothetical protein